MIEQKVSKLSARPATESKLPKFSIKTKKFAVDSLLKVVDLCLVAAAAATQRAKKLLLLFCV